MQNIINETLSLLEITDIATLTAMLIAAVLVVLIVKK